MNTMVGDGASVECAIVEAVAKERGKDPDRVAPPLFDAIDTDALKSLFRDVAEGEVRFEWAECEIQVAYCDERLSIAATHVPSAEQSNEASSEQDLADGD